MLISNSTIGIYGDIMERVVRAKWNRNFHYIFQISSKRWVLVFLPYLQIFKRLKDLLRDYYGDNYIRHYFDRQGNLVVERYYDIESRGFLVDRVKCIEVWRKL